MVTAFRRLPTRAGVALIAVLASPLSAQTPDSTRVVKPRLIGIFDSRTGQPLSDVQVLDSVTGNYTVTTATGTARLDFIPVRAAMARVELRKLGYQPRRLVINGADTASITELMTPVVELAPMITTEAYRLDRDAGKWDGFNQRCTAKLVTCFRQEDLDLKPSANLADFLIRADGMTIGSCGPGTRRNGQCGNIAMRPTVIPPAFCRPTFFVDGFAWSTKMPPPIDLVPGAPPNAPNVPANVKGIEVYPPGRTRPLRFEGGDPSCGVVVIWTR